MRSKKRLKITIFLFLVFNCAISWASSQSTYNRPPEAPQNLSLSPAVNVLNFSLQKNGVPSSIRDHLYSILSKLQKKDLIALKNGANPNNFISPKPNQLDSKNWGILVSSYAEAILTDREIQKEREWSLLMLVVSSIITFILGFFSGRSTSVLKN